MAAGPEGGVAVAGAAGASPAPAAHARVGPAALLVVFAAAWLAHGWILGVGWGAGGAGAVRDDPAVARGLDGLIAAFALDGASDKTWRPLARASRAVEVGLWRRADGALPSFAFRLADLALHALAAVLVAWLLARLLAAPVPGRPTGWIAAAGGLLFAVHPVAAPVLGTLAGRGEVLGLVLALAASGLLLAGWRREPALLPLGALLVFLALLAAPTVAGLPLGVALLAVAGALPAGPGGTRARAAAALLLVLAATLARALLAPDPFPTPVGAALEGVARAAAALLVPVGLVRDALEVSPAGGPGAWSATSSAGLALLFLAALALGLAARRGGGRAAAGLGLALFGVAAGVGAFQAGAARALEAPLAYAVGAGLVLVLGRLLVAAARPARGFRTPLAAAGAAAGLLAVVGLGFLSWREAQAWTHRDVWYASLAERHPLHRDLQLEEVTALRREAEAHRAYLLGLPTASAAYEAEKTVLQRSLSRARATAARLVALDPGDTEATRELGAILLLQGHAAEAERWVRGLLERDPALVRAADGTWTAAPGAAPDARRRAARTLVLLAEARTAQGRTEGTAGIWRLAAALAPEEPRVLARAGTGLAAQQQHGEAVQLLERALAAGAGDDALLRLYGRLREEARGLADRAMRQAQRAEEDRDYRSAAAFYERALEADRLRIQAWLRLAWIRGYQGQYGLGLEILDRAAAAVGDDVGQAPDEARRRIAEEREALEAKRRAAEAREREMLGEGEDD